MTKYNFTCGLCVATTLLSTVLAVGIQIWPDVSELTLTSGADLTLKCTGDVPIKWIDNHYDQSSSKDSSINISHGLANDSYVSQLSLSNASYLDTGYYYCEPISDEHKEEDEYNSNNNIYIYVQHDTHLLAVSEDDVVLTKNEFDNVIIPCRPTSPDVNVTLLKDEEIIEDLDYDKRIGYTLRSPSVLDTGVYSCEANKNNISESRPFTVHVQSNSLVSRVPKPFIKISDSYSNRIILGENVNLNCSVSIDVGVSFNLDWIVPDEHQVMNGRMQVKKAQYSLISQYKVGSRVLSIQNVTYEDEGQYTCKVTLASRKSSSSTFILKVFRPDVSYLNLTVQGGVYEIVRTAGYSKIQWIIKVSGHPTPKLQWRHPNGTEIYEVTKPIKGNEKIYVENTNITSKLVIKNLELYDSGRYELFADNGIHSQTINVTLLVKDMPIVNITRDSKFNELYDIGKVHIFECYVAGYPLPKVEWTFIKCPNYPECEKSSTLIPRNMYKETAIGEIFLSSVVNITATETGILLCNASNELGNSIDESIVLVNDLSDPYGLVVHAPSLFVEGDNITLDCGASIYKYLDNIQWIHKTSNKETYLNIDEKYNITNNKTLFSYHSYLTIKSITNKYGGEYLCRVNELNKQNSELKSIPVKIENTHIPVIVENLKEWNVKTGDPVQMKCYVHGMPPPSVSWFKNNQLLRSVKNDSRVLFLDKNQMLFIRFTALEDEGSYMCKASNRIGNAVSTYSLALIDKPIDHEHFGFIMLFAVLIILLGIFMIACGIRLKKEKKLKDELAKAGLLYFENGAVENWNPDLGIEEQAELLPYDKKWEFPREKLKLGKQLGSGAFGVVFKAEAIGIIDKDTTTTVAVKMVKPNADPSYIKALASELKIMIHLGKHLNVVNLLGAYTGNINKRELMVIVEFCRFGNLHQYLLKQRDYFVDQITPDGYLDYNIKTISKNPYYENVPNNTNVSEKQDDSSMPIGSDGYLVADELEPEWRSNYRGDYNNLIIKPSTTHDLICWSFQVARGMEYLASRKILHGDLATRNILLAEENIVKICDFGFAKTMYNSENYKKKSDEGLLPVKWMAIESLRDRVFSTQSDVWAFGIVLWEIFSLAVTPYPNIQKCNELFSRLVEGYRMEQPKYANSEIYNIMLDCWKMNPMTRPSFTDLAERLGDLLQDGTKSHYMNLNEVYLRMNSVGSQSTDYLSLLTAPTYLNYSNASVNNSNSCQNISENSEIKEDLELKPMLHHNSVEYSGYINLTKPPYFSNPNYDVVDNSKNYSYLQSPCPSYV